MKKKRLLYTALSIIFGTGLIFSAVLSMQHWKNAAFSTVEVKFYYPDNQALVVSSEVEPLITSFLAAQPDSIALKTPAFLLETSLEALPYVADAQVYWNLNESLVVTVVSKQAKAKGLYERPTVFAHPNPRAVARTETNTARLAHHHGGK